MKLKTRFDTPPCRFECHPHLTAFFSMIPAVDLLVENVSRTEIERYAAGQRHVISISLGWMFGRVQLNFFL